MTQAKDRITQAKDSIPFLKKKGPQIDQSEKYENASGFKKWLEGTKLVLREFSADQCTTQAAAIIYFTLLSVFPLLLGIMAVGSLFITDAQSRNDIIKAITDALPDSARSSIDVGTQVNGFLDTLDKNRGILAAFSIITALWSGTGIFAQFMVAANVIFKVPVDKRNFVFKALARVIMLVGLGGVLVASFAITIVIELIKNFGLFDIKAGSFTLLFDLLNFLTPFFLIWLMLVVLYRFTPYYKGIRWQPVFLGALVGSVLFQAAKFGLSLYFGVFNGASGYAATYGALAGVIVFLFYIYITAIVILIGLEVTAVASGVYGRGSGGPVRS